MNKQKGFTPILIVVLIAAAIGGYFIYTNYLTNRMEVTPQNITQSSPTPTDATANWQVYTNTKYGYSIKYPSSLYIEKEGKTGPTLRLEKDRSTDLKERINQPELGVVIQENSDLEKQIADTKSQNPEANFKEIEVNGVKGYRLENIIEGNPLGGISTFLGKENTVFSIILFTSTADQELIDIYNKMVSTFKFTE